MATIFAGPQIADTDPNGIWQVFKAPKVQVPGSSPTDVYGGPATPSVPGSTGYTPAPSVSFGSAGVTPDYASLIAADPGLQAVRAGNTQNLQDAASARKAALRMLAVKYGGLPTGFTDKFGDIDQGTLDQAKNNPYSDEARLGRNYDTTVEGFKRALAARGMLQSGELGYGLNQADVSRGESEYDLGNSFGAAAQGAVNDYAGAAAQARVQEAAAIQQASVAAASNPFNVPSPGTQGTASLDPDWQAKYGRPMYVGPDGQLYDENGQLFGGAPTPFTAAAAPTADPASPDQPQVPIDTAPPPYTAAPPVLPTLYDPTRLLQSGTAYAA